MKGTLTKNSEGVWMVKWSDLHSFAHGTHWMYTELIDNGHIDGLKLYDSNEGLEVEFEIVTNYDNNGPDHFPKFARILTPEEAELKDWDAYKNYLFNSEWFPIANTNGGFIGTKADSDEIMTQELFINKIKTDDEFAKK